MIIELTTLAAAVGLAGLAARATRQAERLLIDPTFGCLNRQGITRRWRPGMAVLFFDLNGMHALNATYGYQEVDRRIREALSVCRRGEAAVGRWYSGDEFVVLVDSADAALRVEVRLGEAMADLGLSAMFGVFASARTLEVGVAMAAEQVQMQKALRDTLRGAA